MYGLHVSFIYPSQSFYATVAFRCPHQIRSKSAINGLWQKCHSNEAAVRQYILSISLNIERNCFYFASTSTHLAASEWDGWKKRCSTPLFWFGERISTLRNRENENKGPRRWKNNDVRNKRVGSRAIRTATLTILEPLAAFGLPMPFDRYVPISHGEGNWMGDVNMCLAYYTIPNGPWEKIQWK